MKTTIHTAGGAIIQGTNTSEALRGLEFLNTLEPVVAPKRYLVTWGLGESERELPTFAEALAIYIENLDARGGVKIWNLDRMVDGEDSGLTADEEAAVELADEMRTVEMGS